MKNILFPMMVFLALFGCQKEELTIKETTEEESFLQDIALKKTVLAVVSHDGSFDDVVDKSSCFSIDFPYVCSYNGRPYNVNSVGDLAPFTIYDELIPHFPVDITFADHKTMEVSTSEQFYELINQCSNNQLYNEIISCVDLVYPVSIALFNPDNSNFETVLFDHDKFTFETISGYSENIRAAINYPIQVILQDSTLISISSNEQLKEEILYILAICE